MRVPLSNIWRAFPELDRFTDEQCRRFVRAACTRGWQRHAHRVTLCGLLVILVVASFAMISFLYAWLDDHYHFRTTLLSLIFVSLILFSGFFIPSVLVMLIRDRLLLRRVRYVLRARGTCPACQYSLLGIVVSEDNVVICPECGLEVEADPSLRELTTDEQGRTRFMPTEGIEGSRFWTARRKRRVKRVAIGLGVFVFLGFPAGWGLYELFLYSQAKTAASERPGVAGMMEFLESHQPSGTTPSDPNAFDVFYEIQMLRGPIAAEVSAQPKYIGDEWSYPYYPLFDEIYSPETGDLDDDDRLRNRIGRELAEELLVAYREGGIFDKIDSLASAPRAIRPMMVGANQPLLEVVLPELGELRELSRINGARMHLALQAGDQDEFLAAFESNLALARILSHQPFVIDSLTAFSIEQVAHSQLRYLFLQHPDADWLDGIEAAIARQRVSLPRDHMFRGEQLVTLDTVAWFFSDTRNTRFGRFSPRLNSMGGGLDSAELGMRLGTYAKNRDSLNEYYDAIAEAAMLDPYERTAVLNYSGNLLLLDLLLPVTHRALGFMSQVEASRRGTTVMLALERHYLVHGSYPNSLAALVPDYLKALPRDPWTGEPMRYRRLDTEGPKYVLYSVGPDAKDDGGQPDAGYIGWRNRNPDLILSPPRREREPTSEGE